MDKKSRRQRLFPRWSHIVLKTSVISALVGPLLFAHSALSLFDFLFSHTPAHLAK
jgi:hypothetical protein